MTLPDSPPHPARPHADPYDNQRAWVRRVGGLDVSGRPRPLFARDGLLAACTGTTGAIMLSDPPDHGLDTLPDALAWLRRHGSGDVLVWAATPHAGADRCVGAHGGRESFTPRWMTRLAALPSPHAPGPATVRAARPGDLPLLLSARELPYHSPWQARSALQLATALAPDDVALVLARIDGEIVGRAVLNRHHDTAGVYDVGVAPRWQRRGIGGQLMAALLDIARGWDVDLVTLNATPAGVALYEHLGFEDAGEGQTWLVPAETVLHPPAPEAVRFALAISGSGSLAGMERLAGRVLPNGDTPLAHAARFDQVGSSLRLLEIGTIPDLAALWQLGLEEEALARMTDRDALDARRGQQRATPLHIAIYWDDLDFLEALLDAGADPTIRDGVFDSDAFGWCHALDRPDALAILTARFPDREPVRS